MTDNTIQWLGYFNIAWGVVYFTMAFRYHVRSTCIRRLIMACQLQATELEIASANQYYLGITDPVKLNNTRSMLYQRSVQIADRIRAIDNASIWEIRRISKLTEKEFELMLYAEEI